MDFRTTIKTRASREPLQHSHKLMLLGSCFSDNIGAKLRTAMVDAMVNPMGTLYNPMSIAAAIHRIIDCEPVAGIDLFEHSGVWNSFAFHSRFSMKSKQATLEKMNAQINAAHNHLRQCRALIITLGTAVVYRLKTTGEVVANCHKLPGQEFTREPAGTAEIERALAPALARLWEFNPQLRVIFTISPIRHIADGLELNSLSKATLRVAVANLTAADRDKRLSYFPAYEILIDDLRDYRFYAADMVHPSDVAIEYTWQTFQATYYDDRATQAIARCERVAKRLQHRPMSNNRDIVDRFNADTDAVLRNLVAEYPYLAERIASMEDGRWKM